MLSIYSDPPHVSIAQQSPFMTTVGSVAVVYCTARGKPIPTVQWYKDGVAFNPLPTPFQQALIVPNHIQHTTVYTCVGINYARKRKHEVFANITVIVKGKSNLHRHRHTTSHIHNCVYYSFTALPSTS